MFKSRYNSFIIIIFLFTTLSGAVRKWIIDSNAINNALLGIMLILPLFLLLIKPEKSLGLVYGKINNMFGIYLFYLIIAAFNPLNLTIYHGLLGIIVHLLFISIIVAYFKHQSQLKVLQFSKLIIFFLIGEVILATFQYTAGSESWLNKYAVAEDVESGVARVGDAIRVTGTFSYIAGYGAFLILASFAILYIVKKNPANKWLFPLIGLLIYGSLLSGSRGTVAFTVVTILVYILLETKLLYEAKNIITLTAVLLGFLFFNTLFSDPLNISQTFNKSYDNFETRVNNSSAEGSTRITRDIKNVFNNNYQYAISGVGLGSTYQGANAIFGTSPYVQGIGYEGELFRFVIEGGYLLLILRLIILVFLLSLFEFSFLFKLYLFLVLNLLTSFVFNIYTGIYFSLGLILLNQAYLPEQELIDEVEED